MTDGPLYINKGVSRGKNPYNGSDISAKNNPVSCGKSVNVSVDVITDLCLHLDRKRMANKANTKIFPFKNVIEDLLLLKFHLI